MRDQLPLWDVVDAPDTRAPETDSSQHKSATVVENDVADGPDSDDGGVDTGSWLGGVETERKDDGQQELFENERAWVDLWKGMPTFEQKDLTPARTLYVHFKAEADVARFADLVGQSITNRTRSIWYPRAENVSLVDKRFVTRGRVVASRYPIYVPTKGRWERPLTIRSLEEMRIPYYAVVEPQEAEQYRSVVKTGEVLTLPFSNLGQGSIPARNWIRDHAIASGVKRHWQLDDNIDGFFRLYQNLKIPVMTGAYFRVMEDFTDRYTNVGVSGPHYFMFASRKNVLPALTLNTRVYSCSLVNHEMPHRWRGRYNEDTDLCLRALKDGWCVILFNAFLCLKQTTMTMKGGNTDELYVGDGRLAMAESLREQHPDCVTVTEKWGRYQHQVDYGRFRRNQLIQDPAVVIQEAADEYGMELEFDDRVQRRTDWDKLQASS